MHRVDPIACEGALIAQLTKLLVEEQGWLSREAPAAPSPFNRRRAEILEQLVEVAEQRNSKANYDVSDMENLRLRAQQLEAANVRNIEMIQERLRGLKRALKQFGGSSDYGNVGPARARLGQG